MRMVGLSTKAALSPLSLPPPDASRVGRYEVDSQSIGKHRQPFLYPSGFPLFRIGRQTLSCALAAPVSAARSLSGISVRSSLNDGDG